MTDFKKGECISWQEDGHEYVGRITDVNKRLWVSGVGLGYGCLAMTQATVSKDNAVVISTEEFLRKIDEQFELIKANTIFSIAEDVARG